MTGPFAARPAAGLPLRSCRAGLTLFLCGVWRPQRLPAKVHLEPASSALCVCRWIVCVLGGCACDTGENGVLGLHCVSVFLADLLLLLTLTDWAPAAS